MRVLVIGAGGHGRVVADILLRMAEAGSNVAVLGFLDDDPQAVGHSRLDLPVLGNLASISNWPHDAIVVAIGDNLVRHSLVSRLAQAGEHFVAACHPRATVAPSATIGPGAMLCGGVVVNPGARIGSHVILNTGSTVDHDSAVGDFAHVGPGAHVGGEVAVGEGALVGIGATVISRRNVGDWATVAAGSLVTKHVPPRVMVAGFPARFAPKRVQHPPVLEPQ